MLYKTLNDRRQLDPFLSEDGLIRVGGRLGRAPISDEASHFTQATSRELIIRHYNEVSGHSGQEYVLSLIRQRYWIIKARTTLRRILTTCFSCRRQAPIQEQKMAHLPEDSHSIEATVFLRRGRLFWSVPCTLRKNHRQTIWCHFYRSSYLSGSH